MKDEKSKIRFIPIAYSKIKHLNNASLFLEKGY